MKYLSVCSGIEAASVAWHPLGWRAQWLSEIEPFPSAVLAHHYPTVPNLGDMTKFAEWPYEPIDLLVGGTPCQSFSVAGLRAGLADPRGNLMLTYLAIAARYSPRWVVWENVPGVLSSNGGRDFGTFLRGLVELGYGFAYRVLDAQYVRVGGFERAVPQRRRRVFVVGHLGDWRRAAAVLFDGASLRGDSPPRREAGKATPAATAPSTDGCCSVSGCDRPAKKRGWCNTHYQRWRKHGFVADTPVNEPGRPDAERFWEKVAKSDGCWEWTAALNEKGYGIFWSGAEQRLVRAHRFSEVQAVAFAQQAGGDQTALGYDPAAGTAPTLSSHQTPGVHHGWAVRRLTPTECERLQGFPDDYLDIAYRGKPAADGPKYKALGNSMAVNVMRWIGERIAMVENMDGMDP